MKHEVLYCSIKPLTAIGKNRGGFAMELQQHMSERTSLISLVLKIWPLNRLKLNGTKGGLATAEMNGSLNIEPLF